MTLPLAPSLQQLIALSLKEAGIVGVGQTPSAEDTTDAMTRFNWMVAQWRRKRWLVWCLRTLVVPMDGSMSYGVGPGQPFDVPVRPARIESAYLRQITQSTPAQLDYPLEILTSREDYNMIPLKSLGSFPQYVWYDNAWPNGMLYPWPVPQASLYAVAISITHEITDSLALTDDVELPPEYFAALNTNLAVILRDAYDLPPKPVLIARAKDALNVIKGSNAQIARLQMPDDLARSGVYNIFTDQYR